MANFPSGVLATAGEGIRLRMLRDSLIKLIRVMKPQLGDFQILAGDSIDHPVLLVDPSRPESAKSVFQRLWFPDPLVG